MEHKDSVMAKKRGLIFLISVLFVLSGCIANNSGDTQPRLGSSIKYFYDFDLLTQKGIGPFNGVLDSDFPYVEVDAQGDSLLKIYSHEGPNNSFLHLLKKTEGGYTRDYTVMEDYCKEHHYEFYEEGLVKKYRFCISMGNKFPRDTETLESISIMTKDGIETIYVYGEDLAMKNIPKFPELVEIDKSMIHLKEISTFNIEDDYLERMRVDSQFELSWIGVDTLIQQFPDTRSVFWLSGKTW